MCNVKIDRVAKALLSLAAFNKQVLQIAKKFTNTNRIIQPDIVITKQIFSSANTQKSLLKPCVFKFERRLQVHSTVKATPFFRSADKFTDA